MMRFCYIFALLMMTFQSQFSQNLQELKKDVESMIHEAQGVFAVSLIDVSTGRSLEINAGERFHAASTMKSPVMLEVFLQAKEGLLSLDDSILVKNEFKSIVDGSTYQMNLGEDSDDSMYRRVGGKATIRELVFQMITVSSNLATNILIDLVDARKVTARMRNLGARDIEVLRGVEDGKAFEKGLNNSTTSHDLAILFYSLAQAKVADSASCNTMIDILLKQKFNDKIPALLPKDVKVAHKTGNINGVEHDSGIIFLPDGRTYVLVVLSKNLRESAAGKSTIAKISKMVYDSFMPSK
jgi:beta-lactamase class A